MGSRYLAEAALWSGEVVSDHRRRPIDVLKNFCKLIAPLLNQSLSHGWVWPEQFLMNRER